MAAAFRAGWSNSTPNSPQNWTIAAAVHDVLLLYCVNDSPGSTFTGATGFTQQAKVTDSFDGQDFYVATKADAAGTETSVTLTTSSGVIGGILAFSGVDNAAPFNVAPTSPAATSGVASPYSTSFTITPTVNGCLLVVTVGFDVSSGADVVASIATTSGTTGAWTKHQDLNSGFYNCAVFSSLQTIAGAVTVQVTGTSAGTSAAIALNYMALKPAAGGSASTYNDTVAEAVTAASTIISTATFPSTITEIAVAGNTLAASNIMPIAVAEAVSMADAYASTAVFATAISEAWTAGDASVASSVMASAIAEGIAAGESFGSAATFLAALSQGVALGDAYSTGGAQTYSDTIAETVSIADALIATSTVQAVLLEQITAGSSTNAGLNASAAVSEAITLADGTLSQWIVASTLSEAIALADAHGTQQVMATALGEQVALLVSISPHGDLIPSTTQLITGAGRIRDKTGSPRIKAITGQTRTRLQ